MVSIKSMNSWKESPDNPRPDSLCRECEEVVNKVGEWNDESEAFAGVRLLCGACYDRAKETMVAVLEVMPLNQALQPRRCAAANKFRENIQRGRPKMKKPDIPQDEEARLKALKSLNILDTLPEERFDRLTRIAKRMFNVPIALVSLIDENRQWFKSCMGLNVSETSREISFCGHTILGDEVFIIPDATKDERFADNPLVINEPYIRFYAGCPLIYADGSRLGTLCIIDQRPRNLSNDVSKA